MEVFLVLGKMQRESSRVVAVHTGNINTYGAKQESKSVMANDYAKSELFNPILACIAGVGPPAR